MLPKSGLFVLAALVVTISAQSKSKDELIDDVFGTGGDDNNGGNSNGGNTNGGSTIPPNRAGGESSTSSGIEGVEGCQCVQFYLCDNNTINTSGQNLIDIRINENERECSSYLEVCCGSDQILPPTTTTAAPIDKPATVKACGVRNLNGAGFRITGDDNGEAQFGEFPWMVAVLREEQIEGNPMPLNVYQCGGSVIHPRVVLTAAHCVAAPNKSFKIRAGEWDTQTTQELLPHQERPVQSISIHEHFNKGSLFNDVALLYLEEPLDFAPQHINRVCFPRQDQNFDMKRCFASGWGKDVFGKAGKYQVIMKKVELPVVPRQQCQAKLRTTRLGKHFILDQSFICAGGETGKDTCKGDGGSPLVCPLAGKPEQYEQAGIVAWGIGCGDNNTPGVYVNVAKFRDWIVEDLAVMGLTLEE